MVMPETVRFAFPEFEMARVFDSVPYRDWVPKARLAGTLIIGPTVDPDS